MEKWVITTKTKPKDQEVQKAIEISRKFSAKYVERRETLDKKLKGKIASDKFTKTALGLINYQRLGKGQIHTSHNFRRSKKIRKK